MLSAGDLRRRRAALSASLAVALALAPGVAFAQGSGTGPVGVGQVILFVLVVGALVAGAYYLLVSRVQGGAAIRYSDEDLKVFEATKKIGRTVSGFAALGLLAVAIVCFGTADAGHAYHAVLGTNLVIAAASAAIGAVIGFIFGIPRVLDAASRVAVANAVGRQTDGKAVFAVNTNLEKVSDWLTTLLIGATLVQIGSIPGRFSAVVR